MLKGARLYPKAIGAEIQRRISRPHGQASGSGGAFGHAAEVAGVIAVGK
jgi:hypothetical protein